MPTLHEEGSLLHDIDFEGNTAGDGDLTA